MALKSLIDRFNQGDIEFISAFGSSDDEEWDRIQRFLKVVESRGLLELIDPSASFDFSDSYTQNSFDWYCFRKPELKEKFIEQACRQLYKDIVYDNGRIFLVLDDYSQLSRLFCSNEYSRRISSYDLAYGILSDGTYEPYSDTTDDVYRDVVGVLTNENFRLFCIYVAENLKEIVLSEYSDDIYGTIIPELAESFGDDKVLRVDKEIIIKMFKDKTTFNFIQQELLTEDFYNSLLQCHSNAYNQALTAEWAEDVNKELASFGIGKGVWGNRNSNGYDYTTTYKVDITDNFNRILSHFLKSHIGFNSTIYDFNNYFSFVEDTENYSDSDEIKCLELRLDDYPNQKNVDKLINESIFEYLDF
jgi:hypothetical protein